ncbi:WD repeat-containing protein 36-like [Ornithodoros turicata]|uniref:WD repeat-containing protein 36-like n=1 Tax=Ornithodoros turicata TaxID=34597 RepID=UPI003138DA65
MPSASDSSRIFCAYKSLGFVCNHLPVVVRYIHRRKEHLVITSVGRSFHTYSSKKLSFLTASPAHEDDITCLAGDSAFVYSSCGREIFSWLRGTELVNTYKGHAKNVLLILPFGKHLVSVDEGGSVIVWDTKTTDVYLELSIDALSFHVTTVLHPLTYINKVLFGSKQGTLQLWNVKTGTHLYTFPGWNCAVTALSQSTAVDIAAVGLSDGRVLLHNLKFDETLFKFTQEWGPVTAISFRMDGVAHMAVGSQLGHISVWDLEKRQLHCQLTGAHKAAVTSLNYLPQEPLLVTSSPDNSLKVWIFDETDGGGRLLKQQCGHSAPPCKVRFRSATDFLTAGLDSSLRSFSTIGDNLNKNLGQASFSRKKAKKLGVARDLGKMPPIVDFAVEVTREKEWDSIAACHRNLGTVTTWTGDRMGQHKLLHDRFKGQADVLAKCVSLSCCGNFVTVGYSSGEVDRYNIQSGLHRMTYGNPAHEGAVRGNASDSLNQTLVTGGGDGRLKFWLFKEGTSIGELQLSSGVAKMELHRESGMLAVATDDFSVLVVDVELQRVVRKFATSRITDMALSPDARWLVTASMDALIQTWDLPSGCLVDCFQVPSPCTSLHLSPSGEYLATCHIDDLGVYLWSNATLYSRVTLAPLPEGYSPKMTELPTNTMPEQEDITENTEDAEVEALCGLVTLSLLPQSRWQNILNIDVVKRRNKPREAAKKLPKSAPFFIPTVTGLEPKFALPENPESRMVSYSFTDQSLLGNLLNSKDYYAVLEKLREMGPSNLDFEIRSLGVHVMLNFMDAMREGLQTCRDFELLESYVALFLKIHADTIASEPLLCDSLHGLCQVHSTVWAPLDSLFNQSLCIANYLRSAIL